MKNFTFTSLFLKQTKAINQKINFIFHKCNFMSRSSVTHFLDHNLHTHIHQKKLIQHLCIHSSCLCWLCNIQYTHVIREKNFIKYGELKQIPIWLGVLFCFIFHLIIFGCYYFVNYFFCFTSLLFMNFKMLFFLFPKVYELWKLLYL